MFARAVLLAALTVLPMAVACGAVGAADAVVRGQKEYELAVGLMGEHNTAAAFEHLFKAIELDRKNPEAHLLLGNLYLLREDFDTAEAELRVARELGEENDAYGEPFVSEVDNSLGVTLVHMKRYDDAISVLRGAASNILNRNPHLAWGNLGWAYYEKGQFDAAIEALAQSVRQQARFCLGFYRLGKTYVAVRDFERAEDALTRCLEVSDTGCRNLQDAWHLRGEARAKLGLRQDAIADFERCVEIASDSDAGRACQGYLEATH